MRAITVRLLRTCYFLFCGTRDYLLNLWDGGGGGYRQGLKGWLQDMPSIIFGMLADLFTWFWSCFVDVGKIILFLMAMAVAYILALCLVGWLFGWIGVAVMILGTIGLLRGSGSGGGGGGVGTRGETTAEFNRSQLRTIYECNLFKAIAGLGRK